MTWLYTISIVYLHNYQYSIQILWTVMKIKKNYNLSPTLFLIFMNELAIEVKQFN